MGKLRLHWQVYVKYCVLASLATGIRPTCRQVSKSLALFGISYGDIRQAVFSAANIPAAIAVVVIASCGVFADYQNSLVADQVARADVLAKVNLLRAKLEGNINGNLQLVRGLVATIATEPYMGQQRFAALASNVVGENSQLRNIAGAPDLVISLMYPMEGNEKAVGLDYRKNPAQRAAALRARDERALVLAGPVDLRQGGQGFIGRFPVFVKSGHGGERFWGIVSAVVDVQRLYQASGVLEDDLGIEVTLTGKDGTGRRRSPVLRRRERGQEQSGQGSRHVPFRLLGNCRHSP